MLGGLFKAEALWHCVFMDLDNKEFIARHHKTAQEDDVARPKQQQSKEAFITFLILMFCAGMYLFLILVMDMNTATRLIASVAFILTALVSVIGFRMHRSQVRQQGELGLLKEVLEGSRGARLITDDSDETMYSNARFEKLCRGVGVPEFKTLMKLFESTSEAAAHFRLLADQAHRGLTDSIELLSVYEDNERWLMVTAQPVAGRAGYVHWRIDDVTTTHNVEGAIRDEREKLIDFTDNAPVGFFSVDESGRFVFANATFARWLGEDLQVLLKQGTLHTYMLEPPTQAKPYELKSGGAPRQVVEIKMKGPAGRNFLASINQVVVIEDGGRVRTRAVVHDLTDEREMRRALEASEDRFQKFFEEAPVGIILVDSDGKISDCNAEFANMMGSDVASVESQKLDTVVDAEFRHSVIGALERIERGKPLNAALDIALKKGDGELITVQMYARRFKEGGNTVLHFIDMTEKKQLEEQFVQSQKMQAVGQLAGGIAHDFNNLLTAIIGFCDLLLLRHKPGDPSFGDIMQVKQNSNRAANLVRQLLAFSRQQTLRPKVQDVTDILTELSHLIRRLIGANIELNLVHGSDLGLVKVDEGQMEQVLINLAVNARDAIEDNSSVEGGVLTVETQNFTNRKVKELISEELPPGHWTMITVKDTGCGISEDNMTRIFEPFFTTKDVGEGTGLGLATVYGIIRQTGGFLDVKSVVGKGTTFYLYLPRAGEDDMEEEEEEELTIPETKDLTGSELILLVEDEDAVRTFSQRALTNKGYEVLTAESGDTALEVFKKEGGDKIDLLITDVVMPNMDGPTLAGHIRESSPNLKIVFMSGYTEDKLKDYMGENIWFLPKPFTLKQLAEKVKDVLGD
jgi:two-component system cell cycle sensor histidine kinase/response regulator CckA